MFGGRPAFSGVNSSYLYVALPKGFFRKCPAPLFFRCVVTSNIAVDYLTLFQSKSLQQKSRYTRTPALFTLCLKRGTKNERLDDHDET